VALVRDGTRLHAPNPRREIRQDDILVIDAEPEDLSAALSSLGLSIRETEQSAEEETKVDADGEEADAKRGPVQLQEFVVMPVSTLTGRTAAAIGMSTRYGLTLIAASRQGRRIVRRIKNMIFRPGDLLLVEGAPESLGSFAAEFNLVPLATRDIRLPQPGKAVASVAIMALAIALTAFGLLPAPAAFALGALAMGATGIIAPQNLYKAVDWPVIVLLAALIPVAGAMATTGTADLLANGLLKQVTMGSPVIAMVLLLVVTMTLSDFMNNAATAAVMCPIALSGAQQLNVNPDPLLMAVAIGASCAFLTPIGHQNNTLIMGPGGLRFGDYWRLGLPMEIIVVAVSVPLLLRIWPL
jgi:di/tricarboxylate transporter